MTKVRAVLYGIPQQKYEPQKYFHTSIKKPKIQYIELYNFEFQSEEPFEKVKTESKYKYVPYPKNRKVIEKKYNLKIPIFIRKLLWKMEELSS